MSHIPLSYVPDPDASDVDLPATAVDLPIVKRRGILGFLSLGGMTIVGAVAGVMGTAIPAAADCQGSPCCQLASCTVCAGRCDCFTCPPGYRKKIWYCSVAGRPIGCGECSGANGSCWDGPFACSKFWDDNSCVC